MEKHQVKTIGHLGIVAGICNEISLIENIDKLIPAPRRKVSVGQAVQSIILNALGFTNRAMYLHKQFNRNLPLDILIGKGVQAEDLHDDCLGKALDALYKYGVTELFYKLASHAFSVYGIPYNFFQLDSTTFSLYGEYNSEAEEVPEKCVRITKGYSKDSHPDLNQVVVSMICAHRSSLPIWIESLSGNSSDKTSFINTIKQFKEQFSKKKLPYFVADSALYTAEGLKQLGEVRWITRVPESIKQAKEHIATTKMDDMEKSKVKGYYFKEVTENYAEIKQRWLIVFSQQAHDREYATLTKNIRKENEQEGKNFWHLNNQSFACEADAIKAAEQFARKLKYHKLQYETNAKNLYEKKGRPERDEKPAKQEWYISGNLVIDSVAVGAASGRKGYFIIATNELDDTALNCEQMLDVYKAQGVSVERGFRFLKDPLFYAESLYLKMPERIMALIMIMGLSLLVYSLAERKLRQELDKADLTVPNQLGKPTRTPTIRWIFQLFYPVMILSVCEGGKMKHILQYFEPYHEVVIKCLGDNVKKMYFL